MFVSGTLFTVAFVWMAITSYDVDKEEIKVFLILSFMLVAALIICSLFFSFLLRLMRGKNDGMLERISREQKPGADETKNE
ncbi:MAG: hypothetical protein ABGY96_05680 [bacterium]|nr:hypothetical protein [Gammaproteobacteria bacterium]HIL98646.1 hypothetical protein [Pseudomonadales bacterium]